jgi:short-subunit dehydrogenase
MAQPKRIFLTGATSGIGEAIFNTFVGNNDHVIACGRNEKQLISISKDAYQTCLFDITNKEEVKLKSTEIDEIDILILNAGNCRYIDDAKQFDGELFSDVINTNLTSLGWLLAYFLPKVKKGGQVVFVSSSATILPFPRSEAYGASKAGMDYLASSLRLDLAQHNIGVTLVHPGFVKTPLTEKNDFPMPFVISKEEAAERIFKGIKAKKNYIHFPKRLTLLLKLFSFLPTSLWHSLILRKQNR